MTMLGLLSYVDRSVLAILSPTILAALNLSATQYGYAILVFSLCYMLSNPWEPCADGRFYLACAWRAVCWVLAKERPFLLA
jgi:hypothetical protein